MTEKIDTSTWDCEYIAVPVSALNVKKVEHEVVEWEASFCSEDAIPLKLVYDKYSQSALAFEVLNGRINGASE